MGLKTWRIPLTQQLSSYWDIMAQAPESSLGLQHHSVYVENPSHVPTTPLCQNLGSIYKLKKQRLGAGGSLHSRSDLTLGIVEQREETDVEFKMSALSTRVLAWADSKG